MKYKCIVSDLDRTLLGKGGVLSPMTKAVLEELMTNGISFVPASGRSLHSMPESICSLSHVKYAITSNGAALCDMQKKEILWSSKVSETLAEELLELLKGLTLTYEVFIDGKAYTSAVYHQDPLAFGASEGAVAYVQSTRVPVENIEAFMLEHAEHLDCIVVVVPEEEKWQVYRMIEEHLTGFYITTSVPYLIELSAIDSGKHNGMKRVADLLGISMEEIVAFGDAENDYEMLKAAGLGIAVENAVPLCKEAADWITNPNQEDGVARALVQVFDLPLEVFDKFREN